MPKKGLVTKYYIIPVVLVCVTVAVLALLTLGNKPDSVEVIAGESSGDSFISKNQSANEDDSIGSDTDSSHSELSEPDISEQELSEPQEEPVVYTFEYVGDLSGVSEEALKNLEEVLQSQENSVSIYYENLETGLSLTYRANEIYHSASVVKAPYVKYILSLPDIDLEEEITSSTSVHGYRTGTKFTVRELIYYTIVFSDNNSYHELVYRFGADGFNQMSGLLGASCKISESYHFCNMTVSESAVFFKDIYEAEITNENMGVLTENMKNCDYNRQIGMALGDLYPVAHKYGANPISKRIAFHSSAIVYAPSPYILCIFTDLYPKESSTPIFRDIATAIDEINKQLY